MRAITDKIIELIIARTEFISRFFLIIAENNNIRRFSKSIYVS